MVANEVDPRDVREDPTRRRDADHLAPQVARREDELLRDDALVEDALLAVEVAEEPIERLNPLCEPTLDVRPLVRRDDARDQVEGEDPVGPCLVAVDREADPLRREEGICGADPLLETVVAQCSEPLVEGAVVRAGAPVGIEHLVEEGADVVAGDQPCAGRRRRGVGRVLPGCPSCAGRCQERHPTAPSTFPAVARPRYPKRGEPLPPPLPPVSRTVGQVVAEAIKLYQAHFFAALGLGLPVAVVDQVIATESVVDRVALLVAVSPLFSLAYAAASAIRQGERPPLRTWVVAVLVGVATFLPAAFFFGWFVIAAILWLGLTGHGVPAVMAERLGFLGALRRTVELGRADYIHAAGSFAALALLFGLTRLALGLLLQSQADTAVRAAIFIADLVISPLLFLGAAIVYVDLAARVGVSRDERRKLRRSAVGRPE